ncbi:MAG: TonB-dependent receptor [Acidobacteriaceae bacterium]|nr:TonB-dependent receptor [Acidobacteriaceae bacterium]
MRFVWKSRLFVWGLLLPAGVTFAYSATAQQSSSATTAVRDTVTVIGVVDPVTQADSERATTALDVQPVRNLVDGASSLLRDDSSVDIQQRGNGGVQNDVSIRGSSYEQTLVLLNGLRINDAQTSHFNFDIPVPFQALSGVYTLHGAGSTLYGSDAVSGVVNLTTAKPVSGYSARLRAGAGSFGGNSESAVLGYGSQRFSEQLSGARDFSEGFMADRDYRSEEVASDSYLHSALGEGSVLLATSDRAYGAAQFYGNYPSYERTKDWYAALQQQLGSSMSTALAYRRHTDVFTLYRTNPAAYQNNHIDTSWQGVLRRHDDFHWQSLTLDSGLDFNFDQIDSSNLGKHGRNRGAGYLNARLRTTRHGAVTLGAREEVFSGGTQVFIPSFAVDQYLGERLKLRGAISRGFRVPTYTDLYYSDPTSKGNPNLKPENAWSYEGGADYYPSDRWALSATGFTSSQTNVIDYVRATSSDLWQAANLTHIQLSGVELAAEWRPRAGQQIRVSLTTLTGARDALNGLQSEYVFNYANQNASVVYNGSFRNGLTLRERLRVVNRFDGQLYPVFDSSLAYERWRLHPYLQMTNLNNASYQEVIGVPMPPRAFAGGIELALGKR